MHRAIAAALVALVLAGCQGAQYIKVNPPVIVAENQLGGTAADLLAGSVSTAPHTFVPSCPSQAQKVGAWQGVQDALATLHLESFALHSPYTNFTSRLNMHPDSDSAWWELDARPVRGEGHYQVYKRVGPDVQTTTFGGLEWYQQYDRSSLYYTDPDEWAKNFQKVADHMAAFDVDALHAECYAVGGIQVIAYVEEAEGEGWEFLIERGGRHRLMAHLAPPDEPGPIYANVGTQMWFLYPGAPFDLDPTVPKTPLQVHAFPERDYDGGWFHFTLHPEGAMKGTAPLADFGVHRAHWADDCDDPRSTAYLDAGGHTWPDGAWFTFTDADGDGVLADGDRFEGRFPIEEQLCLYDHWAGAPANVYMGGR